MLRCYNDEALEFVDCLGTTGNNRLAGRGQGADGTSESLSAGTCLMATAQRGTRRTDRVDPVAFGASNAFDTANLDDILSGLRQRV